MCIAFVGCPITQSPCSLSASRRWQREDGLSGLRRRSRVRRTRARAHLRPAPGPANKIQNGLQQSIHLQAHFIRNVLDVSLRRSIHREARPPAPFPRPSLVQGCPLMIDPGPPAPEEATIHLASTDRNSGFQLSATTSIYREQLSLTLHETPPEPDSSHGVECSCVCSAQIGGRARGRACQDQGRG